MTNDKKFAEIMLEMLKEKRKIIDTNIFERCKNISLQHKMKITTGKNVN